MTLDAVYQLIEREAAKAGSQTNLAHRIGVSPAYLHDVLKGRREPGPAILTPLGLEKAPTSYRKIRT
jgi:DNA-binding transcriptional regulator YdaS (Cro superfamily)